MIQAGWTEAAGSSLGQAGKRRHLHAPAGRKAGGGATDKARAAVLADAFWRAFRRFGHTPPSISCRQACLDPGRADHRAERIAAAGDIVSPQGKRVDYRRRSMRIEKAGQVKLAGKSVGHEMLSGGGGLSGGSRRCRQRQQALGLAEESAGTGAQVVTGFMAACRRKRCYARNTGVEQFRIETVWLNAYHRGTPLSSYAQHLSFDEVVVARRCLEPMVPMSSRSANEASR